MKVLVVDDIQSDLNLISEGVKAAGHEPTACLTLSAARRELQRAQFDIIYLDNYFPPTMGGGTGIESIRSFRELAPNSEIVITTSNRVSPDLVQIIVEEGVGFLVKPTGSSIRIRLDLALRVARRESEAKNRRALIGKMRKACDGGDEGVIRYLRFWDPSTKKNAVQVKSVSRVAGKPVIFEFLLSHTVQSGQKYVIKDVFSVKVGASMKASTEFGLGLGIGESENFFLTPLGIKLKTKLLAKAALSEDGSLSREYHRGQVFMISQEDEARGVKKREYYFGLAHEQWSAVLTMGCKSCGVLQECKVFVFVPKVIAEASVAYDGSGEVIEDGRKGFKLFDISEKLIS